jgi:hypothetical protein
MGAFAYRLEQADGTPADPPTLRMAVTDKVIAAIGHLHGHGVAIEATNESAGGASICKSVARLTHWTYTVCFPCPPAQEMRQPRPGGKPIGVRPPRPQLRACRAASIGAALRRRV